MKHEHDNRLRSRVSVATVVGDRSGPRYRFLMVEEEVDYGDMPIIVGHPAGHIEAGENVLACGAREVFEETGYAVKILGLLGVNLITLEKGNYIRFMLAAELLNAYEPPAKLENDTLTSKVLWLTREEICLTPNLRNGHQLPMVDDFLKGDWTSPSAVFGQFDKYW